jgi:class 3 adenylate cyclase
VRSLPNVNDSISWTAKVMEANVYRAQEKYEEEINEWLKSLEWLQSKNNLWWNVIAYKRLADAYRDIKDYDSAIVYLNKANDFHQSYDPDSPDLYQYYVDIALIFELKGNTSKSLGYLKTASKEMRKANNDLSEAEISHRIAYIYFDISKYDQAKEYNDKALRISNSNDFDELLLRAYYLAFQIDQKLDQDQDALDNYTKYSELNLRFNNEEKENIRDTYLKQYQIERAEKQYKLIIASEELKDFELEQFKLEREKTEAELNLLKEQKSLKEIELQNQTLLANETKSQLELARKNNEAISQAREIERLESDRQLSKLQLEEQKSKELADQRMIENLTQENENKQLMLEIESGKINRVRWFSVFSIVIVILLIVFLTTKIKANKILFSKNQEIAYQHREIEIKNKKLAAEKGKTDSLLLNILPHETAEELKSTGKALPKMYENVSVLFTDFSGFTKLTEKMDPIEVLNNLEFMFTRFDEIASNNGLERIKTIGDGYMCAGGLPVENETHAIDAVRSGLAFIQALTDFNEDQKRIGKPVWQLRIGINSGKVVAGVIGKRKFAYDIWGDTVNLASRAESHGLLNKINITENTYNQIDHLFDCKYRGEVEVKNIGKVKMYIVLGEKATLE